MGNRYFSYVEISELGPNIFSEVPALIRPVRSSTGKRGCGAPDLDVAADKNPILTIFDC